MAIQGTCDERFSGVREAFEMNFVERDDMIYDAGASVAVTYDGELVVDLWGGTIDTDADRNVPWDDTIINVWSTTKRCRRSPVSCWPTAANSTSTHPWRYWPEFKAGGKGEIEVRHVMSHTAGLAGWSEPLPVEGLYDWERATSILAAQEPWWQPGTASGYHALTQGYLEGELVRRITGQTFGQFAAEQVTGPLGVDFHIGTSAEHDARIAHVIPGDAELASPAPATRRSPGGRSRICPISRPAPPTPRRGGARRSPLPAAMGTPAQSPSCTPPWRAAARPMACGCCHQRASSRCSTSSATGKTSCCRSSCATGSVSGCPAPRCRSARASARASGAAGVARWR